MNRAVILGLGLGLGWLLSTLLLWAFAFYHAPESTPEWLLRAQAACFGKTESGLPDTGGWLLLILSPALLLLSITVALPTEMSAAADFLLKHSYGRALLLVLTLVTLTESIWVSRRITQGISIARTSFDPVPGGELPTNYPRGQSPAFDFQLVDQTGQRRRVSDFGNQTIILTFAFAHCRTVCPALIRTAQAAIEKLQGSKAVLFLVTIDPWRDTPSSLASLAQLWNLKSGQYILSGEPEKVLETLQAYNLPIQRSELDGDIVHPALLYVIDSQGKLAYAFNNPPASWVVQAVARLSQDTSAK